MKEYSLHQAPRTADFTQLFVGRGSSAGPLRYVELNSSSHRPHKGFLEELVYNPTNLNGPTVDGHDAMELEFTSFTRATLSAATGIVFTRDYVPISETLASSRYFFSSDKIEELISNKTAAARHIKEPCVFFSHGALAVYGHFFCEVLVSMFSLLPLLRAGKIKVIMPPILRDDRRWPDLLLDQLGVPRQSRIHLTDGHTTFSNLIVCSSCSGSGTFAPGMALPRFGENLRKQVKPAAQRIRLYLTRKGGPTNTQSREIENENSLLAELRKLNFIVCEPSQLPLGKQVELFAQAECVCGVHGSAFANIAFCQPGTLIAEVLPSHWAEIGGRWIANISNVCDLKYFYMIGQSTEMSRGKSTVYIDPEIISERLHGYFAKRPSSSTVG